MAPCSPPSRPLRAASGGGLRPVLTAASAAHHWTLAKHDGRAEAALIALHGLRSLNSISGAAA